MDRAELIGGRLAVWSADGAGTEVELAISGTRAYAGALERGQRGMADTSEDVDAIAD
jgi:hypothetical protein